MVKVFLLSFVLGMAVVLGMVRFLSVGGISPNLSLIVFLLLLFNQSRIHISILEQGLLFLIFLAFWFFWSGFFWLWPALVLLFLVVLVRIFRRYFTGNKLVDFILCLAVLTALFYGLLAGIGSANFILPKVFFEIIYNVGLGIVLWFLTVKLLSKYAKTNA